MDLCKHATAFSRNVALAIVLCLLGTGAQAAPVDALRATLFNEARTALAAANEMKAAIYAPVSYGAAAVAYRNAEERLEDGGSIESIRRSLAEAKTQFDAATTAAALAQTAFAETIQARDDAINAEAERFASSLWRDAEVTFASAATRLENGSKRSADRMANKARDEYREAELSAIKSNYLSETKSILEKASDARASRYAPITLAKATELLATAERDLTADRYDTDKPRSLAQQAKYEARHALYLTEFGKQARDGWAASESLILGWEDAIRRVADQLDTAVYFDQGPEAAIKVLMTRVAELQSKLADTQNQVLDKEQQIIAQSQRLDALQTQLGGETASRRQKDALVAEMDRLLANQERTRQRFQQLESMFAPETATVLRRGDDLIIRMVGLNFDSGKSTIKTEHYDLLRQLREAFDLFPAARIVVEGHTDSYGSDGLNLELSEARARAVEEYLRAVMNVAPETISSVGFGETKPVANNETADGRLRNRRIDVLIMNSGSAGAG